MYENIRIRNGCKCATPEWRTKSPGVRKPFYASAAVHCCSARAVAGHCKPLRPHNTSRIPTGFYVSYVSKPDVDFLYREIYDEKVYMQHGVRLLPGDTVVDVGANIGMFAMYCSEIVGPQVKALWQYEYVVCVCLSCETRECLLCMTISGDKGVQGKVLHQAPGKVLH
jgi:hypothetical protein